MKKTVHIDLEAELEEAVRTALADILSPFEGLLGAVVAFLRLCGLVATPEEPTLPVDVDLTDDGAELRLHHGEMTETLSFRAE